VIFVAKLTPRRSWTAGAAAFVLVRIDEIVWWPPVERRPRQSAPEAHQRRSGRAGCKEPTATARASCAL